MICLVQSGINKHSQFFLWPQTALAPWARAILLKKFTRDYLLQIALEIM